MFTIEDDLKNNKIFDNVYCMEDLRMYRVHSYEMQKGVITLCIQDEESNREERVLLGDHRHDIRKRLLQHNFSEVLRAYRKVNPPYRSKRANFPFLDCF